jgi:SAM-dependent methyltransferase
MSLPTCENGVRDMTNLFDLSDEYDSMLERGIRLSGENKTFFLEGRVRELKLRLPAAFRPRRILDFGCGIGDSTAHLARAFPNADVIVGTDTADRALEHARQKHGSSRTEFIPMSELSARTDEFDLVYVANVFHHIVPDQRPGALSLIRGSTTAGAILALFENNPWNPGTRIVMSRIPFDDDAVTLSVIEARRLVKEAGFRDVLEVRSLFYFPKLLERLRILEPALGRLPLGAQHYVIARRS